MSICCLWQLDIFATQIRYNLFHKFRYNINSLFSSRSDISSRKAYRVQSTYRKFQRNLYRYRVFFRTLCMVCAFFTFHLLSAHADSFNYHWLYRYICHSHVIRCCFGFCNLVYNFKTFCNLTECSVVTV